MIMKDKIKECFERLQKLDINPTLTNMEILLQTLYDLRDIYNEIGGDDNGRNQADPERSDNH